MTTTAPHQTTSITSFFQKVVQKIAAPGGAAAATTTPTTGATTTGTTSFFQEVLQSLFSNLDAPIAANASGSSSSSSSSFFGGGVIGSANTAKFPPHLDISNPFGNVYVVGPPIATSSPTHNNNNGANPSGSDKALPRKFTNDASALATFLNEQVNPSNILYANLSRSTKLDLEKLNYAVVEYDLDRPTLVMLEEVVDAIHCWLTSDTRNIVVITCVNGIKASMLAAACLAQRMGYTKSVSEGLVRFFAARLNLRKPYTSIVQRLPPSYSRWLRAYQSRAPLRAAALSVPQPSNNKRRGGGGATVVDSNIDLVAVILRHLPLKSVDDAEGIFACPSFKVIHSGATGSLESNYFHTVNPGSEETFSFDVPRGFWGFKLATPFKITADACLIVTLDQTLLFTFPFHASMYGEGAFQLKPDEMDEEKRHALPGDFSMELVFKSSGKPSNAETESAPPLTPLQSLSRHHVVDPSRRGVRDLVRAGFDRDIAQFALQRAGNDVMKAAALLGRGAAVKGRLPIVSTPPTVTKTSKKLNFDDLDDPTLSPFLRETIGRGLSSSGKKRRGKRTAAVSPGGDENDVMKATQASPISSLPSFDNKEEEKNREGENVAEDEEEEEDIDAVLMSEVSRLLGKEDADKLKSGKATRLRVEFEGDDVENVTTPADGGDDDHDGEKNDHQEPAPVTIGMKCEKYFKMLKMGVPRPAVEHKMTQDGVNPIWLNATDLDALFVEEEKIEVKEEEEKKKKDQAKASNEVAIRPKKLHWTTIPSERISNKETIWTSTSSLLTYPTARGETVDGDDGEEIELPSSRNSNDNIEGVDVLNISADLERMFLGTTGGPQTATSNPPVATAPGGITTLTPKAISMLDPRRAQNVSIGIAKLKMPVDTYIKALLAMDVEIMTVGVVEIVKGCAIYPMVTNQDEIGALLAIPEGRPMVECDVFLREVARRVPDAANRIDAFMFRYVFDELLEKGEREAVAVKTACREVRESEGLKSLLKVILSIGNALNKSDEVRGFTLASLLKLSQTKDVSKTTTVLEYLVTFLHKKLPVLLDFHREIPSMVGVKGVSLAALGKQMRDMERGLTALRSFSPVYAEEAIARLKRYEEGTLSESLEVFAATLEYFGEDPEMDSSEFFGILESFINSFKDARSAFDERRKKEERKAMAKTSSSMKATASNGGERLPSSHEQPPQQNKQQDENRNPNEMVSNPPSSSWKAPAPDANGVITLSLASFLKSL